MNLQTEIPLEKHSENQIDYQSSILLLGSCFVENIGEQLEYFKFRNLQNPFGIIFNPTVIAGLISNAVEDKVYSENDVFFHNERWHCYDAHSDLSAASKADLLQNLNTAIASTRQQIRESSHIIITLGTAWVYNHVESNTIVANCHKVPQKQFKKEILSIKTITENLESIINAIKTLNTNVSVIFTVSPVRHLKDGFVENQQSKAHLIAAIHQSLSLQAESGRLFYFPSYEIIMDELRDYRFYADDMIHPNQTAVRYIWEKFKMVWISSEAFRAMDDVDAIQRGLSHKPFNYDSQEHKSFLKRLEQKIHTITQEYPYMTFELRKRFRN